MSSPVSIPVFIEPTANDRFVARTGEPLDIAGEGATPGESLERAAQLSAERVAGGMRVGFVEMPANASASLPTPIFAPDDPLVIEWRGLIDEHRRQLDAMPDLP